MITEMQWGGNLLPFEPGSCSCGCACTCTCEGSSWQRSSMAAGVAGGIAAGGAGANAAVSPTPL